MNFLDLLFYMGLGILALFGFQYANRFSKVMKFDWRTWAAITASILLIVLGIAWAYVSFLEHENGAAWMGLILFGGLGIVFAFLARQLARIAK
jgi:uncharacterized membrane protein